MPVRLFGVVAEDGQEVVTGGHPPVSQVAFRDLLALVAVQESYQAEPVTPQTAAAHRQVVEAFWRDRAIVPAPVGTVFRDEGLLQQWLELHYVTLNDALTFVDEREAARVHIRRADGVLGEDDTGSDLAAAAAEAYRALRRQAVAAIPLKHEHLTGIVLSGAFLVDRALWPAFVKVVEQQRQERSRLRFELTGPWAPYDFVRMRFGG